MADDKNKLGTVFRGGLADRCGRSIFGSAASRWTLRYAAHPVLAALILFAAMPAWAELTLKFGLYASEKPTLLVTQFRPLLDYVEQAMSYEMGEPVRIEIEVAPDYDAGISVLASGSVDFARLGPASTLKALRMQPKIEVMALEKEGGGKFFHGVIFTRADSGVHRLADLKGKRFAFGDPNSTSGRYLAQYSLLHAGVRARDLSGYEYLGRHDRVAEAVWLSDFVAGAVKEDVFIRMQKEGRAVKSLARMKNITGPWAARAGLRSAIVSSLRSALLAMPEAVASASIKKQGFLPYAAGDLELARQAVEANAQFFVGAAGSGS